MTAKKIMPIDSIIANIEKTMKNTSSPVIEKAPTLKDFSTVPVISFGFDNVDEASYCGGIPKGKLVEIFGPESGGKSLLSLKLIASAQKEGMLCCLVDAENSYDPIWADSHGVNTEELYIIRKPLSAEDTLEYVDGLCASGGFGLVVVDSTAALVPQKELEGKISDQDYALLARAMSKACRKIVSSCSDAGTTCVFLNQIREKMGVMFGDNTTTPGGRALKFYSHQRIKVTPGSKIRVKEGDKSVIIARQSYVQFVKNKAARPFGECIMEIVFDKTARNPVVKLCKAAKDYKVVSLRSGTFRLSKNLFDDAKKNVDTETVTTVELADYLIKNNLVEKVLNAYIEAFEEDDNDDKIDKEIYAMLEDKSLIVSPLDGASVEKIQDVPAIEEETEDDEEFNELD